MKCPRCSYEWDVRQGLCPRCSLRARVPGLSQGSTKRLVPMRASPLDDFVATPDTGERTDPVRSGYLREPTSDSLGQYRFPMPSNRLQSSRFPLPSTGNLDPTKAILPISGETPVLSVQQALSTLRLSSLGTRADMPPLPSGTSLHRDRYTLQKNLHEQEWPLGIVETTWTAFDTRVAQSPVIIYELGMPNDVPKEAQVIPYTATKVFTSIGRNAHILSLQDVFTDKGRSFFVFEPVDGLSLLTLLFNNGRRLAEREVITCCLQLVELLEVCSQQSPLLVHGNIRPEYIVRKSTDSQYVLTNFSVALAGGLAQIAADMENVSSSPHTNDTLMRGKTDGRTDLYALLSMAYYAVTGHWLSDINSMAAGTNLSPQLRAIFLKGLRAPLPQRYQSPSELYHDLVALSGGYEQLSPSRLFVISEQNTSPSARLAQAVTSEPTDFIVPEQPEEESSEHTLLVPLPEELPPLKEAPDLLNAFLWFAGMLLCLVLLLGHNLLA